MDPWVRGLRISYLFVSKFVSFISMIDEGLDLKLATEIGRTHKLDNLLVALVHACSVVRLQAVHSPNVAKLEKNVSLFMCTKTIDAASVPMISRLPPLIELFGFLGEGTCSSRNETFL